MEKLLNDAGSESDLSGLDISVHARICLQIFEKILINNGSDQELVKPSSVLEIAYTGAKKLLNDLLVSPKFATPIKAVALLEQSNDACECSERGSSVIQDLVLTSSFLWSHVVQTSGDNIASLISSMVALAPYWVIASLISQLKASKSDSDVLEKRQLTEALKMMLSNPVTLKASCDIIEECLVKFQFKQEKESKTALIVQIISRLRKALKTYMCSPLLFAVNLALALRYDVTAKVEKMKNRPEGWASMILQQSDENSTEVVRLIVSCCPRLALRVDSINQATPLTYITAVRYANRDSAYPFERLAVSLVKAIALQVPSVLTIPDKHGMCPLHYAARRGHSEVMQYIAIHFPFTVPLRDATGKYPLHHAVLNWQTHHIDTIVELAKIYPQVLAESAVSSGAFNVLVFSTNSCPAPLVEKLTAIAKEIGVTITAKQEQDEIRVPNTPTPSACSTDIEMSESELTNLSCNSSVSTDDSELLEYADSLLMLQNSGKRKSSHHSESQRENKKRVKK